MGPLSYMRSVVDRNVVMRHILVLTVLMMVFNIVQVVGRTFTQTITLYTSKSNFPNFCYIQNIEIQILHKFRT